MRVYFDLPKDTHRLLTAAAERQGLDVGGYILARGLAAPVTITGDFETAPPPPEKK